MVDPAVVQNNVDFLGWLKVGSVFRSDSEDICVTSGLTVFDTKLLTSIPVFKCHTELLVDGTFSNPRHQIISYRGLLHNPSNITVKRSP